MPRSLLLGRLVDLVEVRDRAAGPRLGEHLRDRRGQRGLAMVDVPDGADVQVRLVALELLFGHVSRSPFSRPLSWFSVSFSAIECGTSA